MAWFRGNTHAHTTISDGDTDLDNVVDFYAKRGYDWIAITDHWRGLPRDEVNRLSDKYDILVVPGNEYSGTAHVVGLGITTDFDSSKYKSKDAVEHMQTGVNLIRDLGGVPILAHPMWLYRWDATEALQIKNCNLFELHNASSDCNTFAAGGHRGTDDLWNDVLNTGMRLYGVGSDDAHQYNPETFHMQHNSAHGAEGWTYVECDTCDEASVLSALDAGRCVVSSGAYPVNVGLVDGDYVVEIDDSYDWFRFTTTFIGAYGVLSEEHGRTTRYTINGNEKWVRARVFCSSGKYMWTQPVFV